VVGDAGIYDRASGDHEAFWVEQAQQLTWTRPWDTVMEWNAPWVTWFAGGQLNASANCLDRHVEAGGGDKVAFYWEGEPGDTRVLTYRDLLDEVSKLANALRSLGVGKGDRVNIYLGMVPELPIAMLACARIGAPHSVGVRRVQRRGPPGPDQRRRGEGLDHGRRRVAPRHGRPAQGQRRRRPSRSVRASST
jgi:acetyl-CoA synthetase